MPLTVQHAKNLTIADYTGTVTVGNSSGGSTTALATDLARPSDWNSVHNITFSPNASEIASLFTFKNGLTSSTSTNGITAGIGYGEFFEPVPLLSTVSASAPLEVFPCVIPFALSSGIIQIPFINATGSLFQNSNVWSATVTASNTKTIQHNEYIGLYSYGSGASSTRIDCVWSTSIETKATWEYRHSGSTTSNGTVSNYLTLSILNNIDYSGGVTYTTVSGSGTTSYGASTGASSIATALISAPLQYFSGSVLAAFPFATSLPAGAYCFARAGSNATTASGTNNTGVRAHTPNRVYVSLVDSVVYKRVGFSTTNVSTLPRLFHGASVGANSLASAIDNTGLVNANSRILYWNYMRTTI